MNRFAASVVCESLLSVQAKEKEEENEEEDDGRKSHSVRNKKRGRRETL